MSINLIQKFSDNKINIKYKKYCAILGKNPSKTARSPFLWNLVFKKKNFLCEMISIDIKKKNLIPILNILEKDLNFKGGCITIPFKEDVFNYLNKKKRLDQITKKIGAVNCIYRKNNELYGANTDGEAARHVFEKKFGSFKKKECLILGYGGVGKAVTAFFNEKLNHKIYVSNRTKIKKKHVIKNKMNYLDWHDIPKILPKIDIVINCTSLGFDKNTKSPIKKEDFKFIKRNKIIFDVIYKPIQTKFLKLAKINKNKTLNGLEMNKIQAILAIKKVLKSSVKFLEIKNALRKV